MRGINARLDRWSNVQSAYIERAERLRLEMKRARNDGSEDYEEIKLQYLTEKRIAQIYGSVVSDFWTFREVDWITETADSQNSDLGGVI